MQIRQNINTDQLKYAVDTYLLVYMLAIEIYCNIVTKFDWEYVACEPLHVYHFALGLKVVFAYMQQEGATFFTEYGHVGY